jgi:serine/threonine protein kinase
LQVNAVQQFSLNKHEKNQYLLKVSNQRAGDVIGATSREFASGQKVFGRYTLIKVLGRGGMGIVWLARDEELERDVALKFLPDLMIQDRSTFDELRRETKRCLELTHPHIVRIYDFLHDERAGGISMEYIDGETLSRLRGAWISSSAVIRTVGSSLPIGDPELARAGRTW